MDSVGRGGRRGGGRWCGLGFLGRGEEVDERLITCRLSLARRLLNSSPELAEAINDAERVECDLEQLLLLVRGKVEAEALRDGELGYFVCLGKKLLHLLAGDTLRYCPCSNDQERLTDFFRRPSTMLVRCAVEVDWGEEGEGGAERLRRLPVKLLGLWGLGVETIA